MMCHMHVRWFEIIIILLSHSSCTPPAHFIYPLSDFSSDVVNSLALFAGIFRKTCLPYRQCLLGVKLFLFHDSPIVAAHFLVVRE